MSREFNSDYNLDFAITGAAGGLDFNNDFNLDFSGGFAPGGTDVAISISEYILVPPVFPIVVPLECQTIIIQSEGV